MNRVGLALLLLAGCTDSSLSSLGAYGSPALIRCFSGGLLIYDGKSTGRVAKVEQSDGWEFREAGTNNFVRVSGACIVRHR